MLTQELLTKLATLAKIDSKVLQDAITSTDEVAIDLPEVLTFTKSELETRDSAKKGNGYADGKKAGVEMAVKELKDEYNLDFEGKDLKDLVDNYGKKVLADAKITPKETEDTIAKLRTTITEQQSKIAEAENRVKAVSINAKVKSLMPENAKGLSKDETEAVLRANGFDWDEDANGNIIVKKNGEQILDTTLQTPVPAADAFKSIFTEKGWMAAGEAAPAGRGGSSSNPQLKATKLSEVEKEWTANGKNIQGSDFSAHVTALANADPTFDMNA